MARMIPDLTDDQLAGVLSNAEARLYRVLRDQLPSDYDVFFQVSWIVRQEDEHARDGEVDFIICHPKFGFLCTEVKGGGVGFNASRGEWYSIDRTGGRNVIKDPVKQAMQAKYSILRKLAESS